jgi:hypothetical protein
MVKVSSSTLFYMLHIAILIKTVHVHTNIRAILLLVVYIYKGHIYQPSEYTLWLSLGDRIDKNIDTYICILIITNE